MALFFKINFSRGVGRSLSYFVEIPEGWEGRGQSSVPYKYGKSREVGGGGGLKGNSLHGGGGIFFGIAHCTFQMTGLSLSFQVVN